MSVNLRRKVPNNNISVQEWLKKATTILRQAGIPSARLDSELLLSDALGVDRTWLVAHDDEEIDPLTAQKELSRRSQREPLAYIRGWQEFYGRRFSVTPDTLIPRPESETMIDILKDLPINTSHSQIVYDIGTGSGCLGVTAALELKNTDVRLVDVSKKALLVAQKNADTYKAAVEQNHSIITFQTSHLLSSVVATPSIILANLPYVDISWERSPETQYEPPLALFADQSGLALIYELIKQASVLLASSGHLLLEADVRQMQSIEHFAQQHRFTTLTQKGYVIALQKVA